MTTREEITDWFDRGVRNNHDYLIVVCDTFDHEDYPVYSSRENFWMEYNRHNGTNMQRIMEVYDLHGPRDEQLMEHRSMRIPTRAI